MREIMDSFLNQLVVRGPEILVAVAILVVGWLVALAVAVLIRVLSEKDGNRQQACGLVGRERTGR